MPSGQLETGRAAALGLGLSGVLREGVEIIGVEVAGEAVDGVGAGVDNGGVEVERKGVLLLKGRMGIEVFREDPFRRQERQIILVVSWRVDGFGDGI